jgi:hypothetical protein
MRHHGQLVTVLLSALFGALIGFVAWVGIELVAVGEFLRYRIAQEEFALAAGIGPSPMALILLMATGCLAGGFFGWQLHRRRQPHDPAT